MSLKVSLVIPVRDEEASIEQLIESIRRQKRRPDEVVLVDGGSTDRTVEIVERLAAGDQSLRLIKTDGASPGKGRNIGIEAAKYDWIALTDAGIILDSDWLEKLVDGVGDADIVYGNFAPQIKSFFIKCANLSYVPPMRQDGTRGRFIASSLMKKQVWESIGGFPDMRAAEDLIFMEAAERAGFKERFVPTAFMHWQLQPDALSTFRKFTLYSKHNVWAGRQWDWHYGIVRNYVVLLPIILLAIFHSKWWLLGVPLWLAARTAKRILSHRYEFGLSSLFNPLILCGVAGLILLIDAATYAGWVQAVISPSPHIQTKPMSKQGADL